MSLKPFTAGYRGGYAIQTPSFDIKQGGCRQTPPTILWFGGSCSSVGSCPSRMGKFVSYLKKLFRV